MIGSAGVGAARRHVRAWVAGMAGAVVLAAGAVPAAAQDNDTTRFKHVFAPTDAYLLGGFALATVAARPLDTWATKRLQSPTLQNSPILGRGATTVRILAVPGSLIGTAAFYGLGRARHDDAMSDVSLHTFEAVAVTGVVTTALKMTAGRARPYVDTSNPHSFKLLRGLQSDAYQSFPSGHTSTAFAAATALTAEASEWRPKDRWIVAGVTYTLATLTGVSRVYNNYHWASDVLGGAAVGTITGLAVVRYNHIHRDNAVNRNLIPNRGRSGIPIVFSIPTR